MSMTILGMGTAKPEGTIAQSDAAAMARQRCCDTPRQRRLLDTIYRQTTIKKRGSVLLPAADPAAAASAPRDGAPDDPQLFDLLGERAHGTDRGPAVSRRMQAYVRRAPALAARSARSALAQSGREAHEITQIVTVSCTGFFSPGLDFHLINALGLDPTVGRTHVGFMGCHGAINGLRVAHALCRSAGGCVLLCAAELCSLHFQYGWNARNILANALFADGAAALVGAASDTASNGRRGGFSRHVSSATPNVASAGALGAESGGWRVRDVASCILPDSRDDMTWTIDDHGFVMTLSPRVPDLIARHLRPWIDQWLDGHGLTLGQVGCWAIHPGGPRILDAVEQVLELPYGAAAASRQVLAEHGNMSSPTVLFILDRLRRSRASCPCVMLAFGPGLTAEAALLV